MQKSLLLSIAIALTTAGCSTSATSPPDQSAGLAVPSAAQIRADPGFAGGVAAEAIGRQLSASDLAVAQAAEFDALERGASGEARVWRGAEGRVHGEVVPGRPYKRGVTDCRDFVHRIAANSGPREIRGSACRNPSGTWARAN